MNTTGATSTDLKAENGSATTIDLTYATKPDSEQFPVVLNSDTVPNDKPSLLTLDGNLDTTGSPSSFSATFSNLTPSSTYDVWVLVARENLAAGQTVTITGAGTPTTFTQIDPNPNDLILNASIGASTNTFDSYALPIESSSGGTIDIGIAGGTDGFAISGLAISASAVPLPAPAWLALLGMAGVAILRYRRAIV